MVVKDIEVNLDTKLQAHDIIVTNKINGVLEAVIIEVSKPVNICIVLDDFEDIVLFETLNFMGTKYLPLQMEPISNDKKKLNFNTAKWFLNDKLRVTIEGSRNSIAKIIFRVC